MAKKHSLGRMLVFGAITGALGGIAAYKHRKAIERTLQDIADQRLLPKQRRRTRSPRRRSRAKAKHLRLTTATLPPRRRTHKRSGTKKHPLPRF